jgi:hypothetical protein
MSKVRAGSIVVSALLTASSAFATPEDCSRLHKAIAATTKVVKGGFQVAHFQDNYLRRAVVQDENDSAAIDEHVQRMDNQTSEDGSDVDCSEPIKTAQAVRDELLKIANMELKAIHSCTDYENAAKATCATEATAIFDARTKLAKGPARNLVIALNRAAPECRGASSIAYVHDVLNTPCAAHAQLCKYLGLIDNANLVRTAWKDNIYKMTGTDLLASMAQRAVGPLKASEAGFRNLGQKPAGGGDKYIFKSVASAEVALVTMNAVDKAYCLDTGGGSGTPPPPSHPQVDGGSGGDDGDTTFHHHSPGGGTHQPTTIAGPGRNQDCSDGCPLQ